MSTEHLAEDEITRRTREVSITVVVAAYDSADTLPRTLESLGAQTCSDFCVLVVDDGSETEMLELVPDDPRFLGHRLPVNAGYAAVTNRALDLIASPWVIFVDSDDSLDPDCLEVLLARGEAERSDAVVLPLRMIDPNGAVSVGPFAAVSSPLPAKDALDLFIAGRFLFNQHLLFRRTQVRARDNTYSDLAFVIALLASASSVSVEPRPLYNYFRHAGSVTAQLRPTVWDMARVVDDAVDALRSVYSGAEVATAIHRLRWMQLSYMLSRAASDTDAPVLRAAVYAWCRAEVRLSHVVDALRTRHLGRGLSLALARVSPMLHGRAYRLRARMKER